MRINRRSMVWGAVMAPAGWAAPALAHVNPEERKGAPAPFKLALAAYSYRDFLQGAKKPMSLLDFIKRAAEMGTDGVELTEYYFEKPITPEYLIEIKRVCHLWGQSITGTPIGNSFTAPAGAERNKQIEAYYKWVDVSATLGSPAIRTFAGTTPKGLSDGDARRNVIETLEIVCDYAAKKGVYVAVENHGGVVAEADGLLEIVKGVKSPWCGVNLDTGNFRTEDPYVDLARCAPYAVTVQYKVDMSPKGKGEQPADFPRVLKILREAGYRGFVTLEYENKEDPLVAVPRHLAAMRKAMQGA
jgi:sugar phosphate isomerase/epimerase